MKKIFKSSLLSVLAALFVVSAYAQVTTSSLGGRVVDSNGEALPGAVVTATHTPSGTLYYAVANERGQYHINGMRAGGPYSVEFSFLGMGAVQYNDIALKLGETYQLDASMVENNELDAVTVVAQKGFNASITGAGSAFSQKQVENMPSIDRSIYDIVKYTPQASIGKNGGISFSGSNNRYNSFQIDGAVANDSFGLAASGTNGGQTGSNPIALDAIEEVQVVIAPFDVRQSGFTGGAINAITKSGTNEIRGTVYGDYYDQNFIGTTAGPTTGDLKINKDGSRTKYEDEISETFGFTVGGPIIKNKLFFFLNGEYKKNSYPNIFTPANGTYDEITLSSPVEYGGKTYSVFDAGLAQAVLAHYKDKYKPYGGYSESIKEHQKTDNFYNVLARVDWNINDAHKLMVRYQYADGSADKYGSGKTSYTYYNSAYRQVNKTNTVVAELNSRLSDKVSNELRATGVFVRDHREPGYKGATMYIKDKVYVNLGTEYSSGANSMNSDTYTLTDNLSIFAGNHNITLGTHNEFYKFDNVYLQYAYGEYTYKSIADFFTGAYQQYDYKFADPAYTGGKTIWAAPTKAAQLGVYAQDEWRVSSDFTLTYGLRVDVPMLLNKPTANDAFNATSFARDNNQYVGVVPRRTPLFSPRLGFRYYIDADHRMLLRGGAGLFTGRVPFVWLSNAYNNTGVETKSITHKDSGLPLTSDPYKDIIEAGILSGSTSGATINTLSRDFKYPQVFRTNLGYDHEFGQGWKFTFDAIYSKTLNNVYFRNLAIKHVANVFGVNSSVGDPAPYYSLSSSDYSAIVALGNTNKGYTYSLSGQLQKHFDFGLDLMASYTFGHAYSVNDGTSSVAYSNWKYNYAVDTNSPSEVSWSLFDKPHKVNFVAMYTSPIYGKRFSTSVSLTYEGGSGQRFSHTMRESSVDFNGDGQYGNSMLYVPTKEEIGQMHFATPADMFKFEKYIQEDSYLHNHRGAWAPRYAGLAPWEHHFDLQVSEDIYYDLKKMRKVTIFANLLNISNLINREWGLYYTGSYNRTVLQVDSLTPDEYGNMTPTYSYYDQNYLTLSDFYSRWRCQVGMRITF